MIENNLRFFCQKYIEIERKFKRPYLLCVCCVITTFLNFWRPLWAIFCLTVDAMACHVLKRRHAFTSTVKQQIAQNSLQKLGKAVRTQQTHNR